jgi:hypothetical protein
MEPEGNAEWLARMLWRGILALILAVGGLATIVLIKWLPTRVAMAFTGMVIGMWVLGRTLEALFRRWTSASAKNRRIADVLWVVASVAAAYLFTEYIQGAVLGIPS